MRAPRSLRSRYRWPAFPTRFPSKFVPLQLCVAEPAHSGATLSPEVGAQPVSAANFGSQDSMKSGGESGARRDAPADRLATEETERWGVLYEQLRQNLVRALAATVGSYDGVEDAIQDAFIAGMKQSPPDLRSPEAWLYTLNKLRTQRRRAMLAARLRLTPPRDPSDIDDALRRSDVLRTLLRLRPRDRELLVAKHYVGMTQEEMAPRAGNRLSEVRMRWGKTLYLREGGRRSRTARAPRWRDETRRRGSAGNDISESRGDSRRLHETAEGEPARLGRRQESSGGEERGAEARRPAMEAAAGAGARATRRARAVRGSAP